MQQTVALFGCCPLLGRSARSVTYGAEETIPSSGIYFFLGYLSMHPALLEVCQPAVFADDMIPLVHSIIRCYAGQEVRLSNDSIPDPALTQGS